MSLPEGLASRLCMTAAGRGRPPQAAARRAGLEFVQKLLTTKLTSSAATERNTSMLRGSLRRSGYLECACRQARNARPAKTIIRPV